MKINVYIGVIGSDHMYELNFIHCNYQSDRYDSCQNHISEKLAQEVLLESKKEGFDINKYLIEKYG